MVSTSRDPPSKASAVWWKRCAGASPPVVSGSHATLSAPSATHSACSMAGSLRRHFEIGCLSRYRVRSVSVCASRQDALVKGNLPGEARCIGVAVFQLVCAKASCNQRTCISGPPNSLPMVL